MSSTDSETASDNEPDHHPQKRRKLNDDAELGSKYEWRQQSISPPRLRRNNGGSTEISKVKAFSPKPHEVKPMAMSSPFQLTHIKDLPDHLNVDTIKLSDILGDPLIKECWQFNYLFDLDFLM